MKTHNKWNTIRWKECEQLLAENQNDLVIATKRGDVKEIKRIQYKMVRMFALRKGSEKSLVIEAKDPPLQVSMEKNGFGQSRK
jgi:hypothetical protein